MAAILSRGRWVNSLFPGRYGCDFKHVNFKHNFSIDILNIQVNIAWNEFQRILLMVSQHWFREWLGAVMQQAITWTSVDQDICYRIMASLGHNELIHHIDLKIGCQ